MTTYTKTITIAAVAAGTTDPFTLSNPGQVSRIVSDVANQLVAYNPNTWTGGTNFTINIDGVSVTVTYTIAGT